MDDIDEELTDDLLREIVTEAFRKASEEAMIVAGSLVEAKDGWLVRRYADGTVVKLKRIGAGSDDV